MSQFFIIFLIGKIQLVGIKRNGDANFTLDGGNNEVVIQERDEGISRSRVMSSSREEEEEFREGIQQDLCPHTPPSSARRRKGIPHRAPFGF